MLLSELIDAVYVETARPDYVDETLQAVQGATMMLHCCDFFVRDIVTCKAVFDAAAYVQTLDTRTMPRYRSLGWFRKYAPSLNSYQEDPTILPPLYDTATGFLANLEMNFLEILTPTSILDEYGVERLDVGYLAGDTFFIKSSTPLQYGLLGYYAYPQLRSDIFSSWVATAFPYAIIYEAAWRVLSMTGNLEAATKYKSADGMKGMAVDEKRNLIIANVTGVGS